METLAELREELKKTQDSNVWEDVREMTRRNGKVELRKDSNDYVPGPYKMEFRKDYLEKLLRGQLKIQKEGPDPNMTLILDEEIHEIQRIWRMEQGDWRNSAYQIYENVIGKRLEEDSEDMGGFGSTEQQLLQTVCKKRNIPYRLVSSLLNAEFEMQGATSHSKIFGKIRKELIKEWRDDADKIMGELVRDRVELDGVKKDASD